MKFKVQLMNLKMDNAKLSDIKKLLSQAKILASKNNAKVEVIKTRLGSVKSFTLWSEGQYILSLHVRAV